MQAGTHPCRHTRAPYHCAAQVGGFFFIHKEDLKKFASSWLSITEDVREDPEAWRLSGDSYVEKGGRPWISEVRMDSQPGGLRSA